MFAGFILQLFYTYMFSGGVSYGLQMSQVVIGLASAKLRYRQEMKTLHCYRFDIDCVAVSGFQSDTLEASRSRGPFVFRLPIRPSIVFPIARSVYFPVIRCLWPGFCFEQNLYFYAAWGLLTMRWFIVNCRFHDPGQRAATATPCISVSRGKCTLNLGRV